MHIKPLPVVAVCFVIAVLMAAAQNPATNPVPRDAKWIVRHEGFVDQAKKGGVDLLFLGDSITDFWRNRGSKTWNKFYKTRNAANFGINYDRTQHLLWRIQNGELEGVQPKVVVLLIGTNNTGKPRNTPTEASEGISAVVKCLRSKLPGSKILLLAIFPRADNGSLQQTLINQINATIARLADGNQVRFLDLGSKFLGPDGIPLADLMPDLLHPNEKGYQLWAESMEGTLAEMLK